MTKHINEQELTTTLETTNGNFTAAAKILEISNNTVSRKAVAAGLHTPGAYKVIYDETIFNQNYECEKQFYLAGYLAQLGEIDEKKFYVRIRSKIKDEIELLLSLFNTTAQLNHNNTSYDFSIYSKKIIDDLKRFGIDENKTLTYKMPDWLKTHQYLNHFLRGCLDAKSTASEEKSGRISIDISSKSLSLIEDIVNLFEGNCGIEKVNIRNNKIRYNKASFEKIAKFIYDNATIYFEKRRGFVRKVFEI